MQSILLVGLGNPGTRYQYTRHNLGAMVVRRFTPGPLSERASVWCDDKEVQAEIAELVLAPGAAFEKVILLCPLVSMNHSGQSVALALKKFTVTSEALLVIHDDIELPLGAVRSKIEGSAAGHNGVRSIQEALSTTQFLRLRLGVGRPTDSIPIRDYVLQNFTAHEETAVHTAIADAQTWLAQFLATGNKETTSLS